MPPASKTPRRGTIHGEGREALCEALVRIVAREGLDGVTFRSVAREAGVTHGLASYHFGTRESMISEALSWAVRGSIERSRLGSEIVSLDDFAADVPAFLADAAQDSVFQFQLTLEAQRREDLRAGVRAMYDEYIEEVRRTLHRLGLANDGPLVDVVFAAIDGITLQQHVYRDPARAAEAIARLRAMIAALSGHAEGTASARSDELEG
jgi:AcrR family transcriptional regulator